MKLVQLFLPLEDNVGRKFPAAEYSRVKAVLGDKFGGMTAFTQSPATGLWDDGEDHFVQDRLVIFEVMAENLDHQWWSNYRATLEQTFTQDVVLIRVFDVATV